MIATEELQELAAFWVHREDPILAKEKIHDLFGGLQPASPHMRADLARLIEVASR